MIISTSPVTLNLSYLSMRDRWRAAWRIIFGVPFTLHNVTVSAARLP